MTLTAGYCFDRIDAEEALKLWDMSGGFKREGRGYTYADDTSAELLGGYDIAMTRNTFAALIERAHSIMFWHYGYDTGCSREVQVDFGNQTLCVNVKCDENINRPEA